MKKTTNTIVEVVSDITCDACGVSVVPELYRMHQDNLDDFEQFGVLQASFGYGSKNDGSSFHFDLCETCFEILANQVKCLRVSSELK